MSCDGAGLACESSGASVWQVRTVFGLVQSKNLATLSTLHRRGLAATMAMAGSAGDLHVLQQHGTKAFDFHVHVPARHCSPVAVPDQVLGAAFRFRECPIDAIHRWNVIPVPA